MMIQKVIEKDRIKDLGGGLVLRRANPADSAELAAFNAQVHGEDPADAERVSVWTRDLLEKPHPTFKPGDFTVVEDTRTGKIVSTMNLISQTWAYGGIPFGVGRPELVGTLPEYRGRGLVRAQFDVVHRWSAERGQMAQMITGIPYYYRLFGYEMGLALGGGRRGFKPNLPRLKDGTSEPFRIRPAGEADLGFIAGLYEASCQRSLVSCVWNEALWRYELSGKSAKNVNRFELRVIETLQGERLGFLAHPIFTWGPVMVAITYELAPGVSWGAVTPCVARYLYATGEALAAAAGKQAEFGSFGFNLGVSHPAYEVLHDALPQVRRPYAYFVRVPDLPAFIQRVAPVLEEHLAASPFAGHSGELYLTFYRSGLRLALEHGRLAQVKAWQPTPQGHSGSAGFPDLTFLQLLFGYHSLAELHQSFADCWYENDETYGLLNALFPKQASDVWPIA
ncbi:MAG TPA: GNAT family N-acetyltransferase [Anaerolineales bacterium]